MDSKNTQIGLTNVVMGGGILLLLLMLRSFTNLQDRIFWVATAMWFYHWYFGLTFVIKNYGATENFLELAFDFIIVGTLISTLFWIDVPKLWFALNATTFLFAVIKYILILKTRKLPENIKKYLREKLKIQCGAVFSLTAAMIISIFYGQNLILGLLTVVFHALAIAYMMFIKLYSV